MKLLLLAVLSVSVFASELQSTKIKKEICEQVGYELVEYTRDRDEFNNTFHVCLEDGKMDVTRIVSNSLLNKTVLLEIDINIKFSEDLKVKTSATAKKSISINNDGEIKLGEWKVYMDDLDYTDTRSLFELIVSESTRVNVGQGDADFGDFDLETFDLEEDRSGREDDDSSTDVTTDWDEMEYLIESYDKYSEIVDLLRKAKKNGEIIGVIVELPNEECDESEYCSFGDTTIYFTNGKYVSLYFDYTT